jgi:hypothetical protein
MVLRNIIERIIRIFKYHFQYFKVSKYSLPLNIGVNIVYTLTTVYNFININNLDNLNCPLKVEDKIINKKDTKLIEVESNIVIN